MPFGEEVDKLKGRVKESFSEGTVEEDVRGLFAEAREERHRLAYPKKKRATSFVNKLKEGLLTDPVKKEFEGEKEFEFFKSLMDVIRLSGEQRRS